MSNSIDMSVPKTILENLLERYKHEHLRGKARDLNLVEVAYIQGHRDGFEKAMQDVTRASMKRR